MHIKYLFTKNQFLKYYLNIGSNKSNINTNNTYYLLGHYYRVVFINLNCVFLSLKKKLNFIIKFSKSKKINFFIINTNKNKFIIRKYQYYCKKLKCSYFNGVWWNGLLQNFKFYSRHNSKNKSKFNFVNNLYPNFTFYIDKQIPSLSSSSKFNFVDRELNKISMINIIFQNSSFNILKNSSVLFVNTKNCLNNFFIYFLCLNLVKKSTFINKKVFFSSIILKYKNLKSKFKKIFFECIFCFYNKKNLIKNYVWDDDLK